MNRVQNMLLKHQNMLLKQIGRQQGKNHCAVAARSAIKN
jgi:hypothetical protein